MAIYGPTVPLLQQRLPLFRFFCHLLGGDAGFNSLRDTLRNTQQGYADDGHSRFYHVMTNQIGLKLPPERLAEYDLRIKNYLVERLNRGRRPPVQWLYFQWLGALFSELFLERFFTDKKTLLRELNEYLNTSLVGGGLNFADEDLTKIAFWMATGSGKTQNNILANYARAGSRHGITATRLASCGPLPSCRSPLSKLLNLPRRNGGAG
jgi:hypothetical protein